MLYLLLLAAVGWVLVRMWTSPVQVVALVLTMHGIRQVGVAALPQVANSPFLMNIAVGGLVAIALALSAIRGRNPPPRGSHAAAWGACLGFYGLYAWCVLATETFRDPSVAELLLQVAPYIVLQLLATTSLVGSSSPKELRETLISAWFICLSIIGIALTDTSLRVEEVDASFRLMLRTQQEETLASNPLALADIGVMLMAITFHVLPGAARAAFPALSQIAWLSAAGGWVRIALVGSVAFAVLWISRVEPAMALLALSITAFAAQGRSRAGLIVAVLIALPLAVASGLAASAFDTLVSWFPRLGTIDEGMAVRASILEQLLDHYFCGGFSVLLFGLGPGYSLMHFGLYPHNHVVECLAELGLVGLVIAAIAPVTAWRRGVSLLRMAPSGPALPNAFFFHTMLTYSILVSMKRGSVVHPDTFMWGAAIGFLYARPLNLRCSAKRSIVRPIATAVTTRAAVLARLERTIPARHHHGAA